MKLKNLYLAAAILPLILTSCATGNAPSDEAPAADQSQIIEYYKQAIGELEEELNTLKEESYILSTSYELKIRELESYISSMESSWGESAAPSPGQTINAENYKSIFEYTVTDEGVVIKKYIGQGENVNVPSSIEGKSVTKIYEYAFHNTNAKCIILPETLTEIDWFAFYACTSLKKIYIPPSVTSIGYGAFDFCPKSLEIYGDSGSYAEKYAKSFAIPFQTI